MLVYLQTDVFSVEKLFEIASKVSTPLAIGGLCVMGFFLILWMILRLPIFANLEGQTAGVIKFIIGTFFVLALVAVVLGISGYVFISVYHPPTVDQPSANIPDGFTIRSAADLIVRPENFTVSFINCKENLLASELLPGPITGKTKVEEIENLPRRRKDASTPLSLVVNKIEARGVYEISCK